MRYILLNKDNKIIDKCSGLEYRIPNPDIPNSEYFQTDKKDLRINDTWDFKLNDSLRDSPLRLIEPEKSEIELIKERLDLIENKLKIKG
ncbi:hypothetical protein ES702_06202 [subsurface metagenome]